LTILNLQNILLRDKKIRSRGCGSLDRARKIVGEAGGGSYFRT